MKNKSILYQRFEYLIPHLSSDVSIVNNKEVCSFTELNSIANQYARLLQTLGVRKGDAIGLLLDHGINIPISILSIHKLGAYYIPLSKESPTEYNQEILNDVNCNFIICDEDISLEGRECTNILDKVLYDKYASTNLHTDVNTNDIAYILYTSGSTAKPKGVVITHSNLSYYIDWYVTSLVPKLKGLPPFISNLRFAAAVSQLYAPLIMGETLHILPKEINNNSEALFQWLAMHPESGLHLVPTLWREHLNYAVNHDVSSPAFVILSGENITEKLRDDSFNRFGETQFWNLYGPTETVANISYQQLSKNREVRIGRILEGSKGIIVNEDLQETKLSGELLVSGPGVCSKYVNRPEINNKSFTLIDGERYYRTGDLVRKDDNGLLQFIGRIDRQIKWNGVRIELQSIENTLLNINGVKNAVVLLVEFEDYEDELIAFVESNEEFPKKYYYSILTKKFPHNYIPQNIVASNNFPKLENGKINTNFLIEKYKNSAKTIIKNTGKNKEILISLLQDISHTKSIKLNDDILELGLHSMALIRLLNRINTIFQTKLSIGDIYSNTSVSSLMELINSQKSNYEITYKESDNNYKELSVNQKAIWIVEHTRTTNNAYNILANIELYSSNIISQKIIDAIQQLCNENDMLRSIFVEYNGKIKRKIIDNYKAEIVQYKLDHDSDTKPIIAKYNTNLSLQNNKPLHRFLLFIFEGNKFQLTIIANHIIFDGLSINILSEKLISILDNTVVSNKATFNTFVQEQIHQIENNSFEEGIKYWKKKLLSTSYFLDLPHDYIRPTNQDYKGDVVNFRIDNNLKNRVINYCKQNNLSLFQFYLGVFSILMHKISNRDELLIAFPYSNRQASEYEDIIGYFTNVVIHKSQINAKSTLKESLQKAKESLNNSMPFWNIPFEELFINLDLKIDASYNPLYQVMFAYHEQNPKGISKSGIEYQTYEIANGASKFDMFLEVQDLEHELELRFSYATSLFKRNRVAQLINHYISIINIIIEKDWQSYSSLSLANKDELSKIDEWNTTTKKYDVDLNLFNLFEQAYNAYPNNIALDSPEKQYTYSELYDNVQKFASKLIFEGVNKKQAVGISMHTSDSMIISMLALARLGVPYVPLDPDYPKARIDYIIEASRLSHIICAEPLIGKSNNKIEVIFEVPDIYLADISTYSAQENDLLYIMFTSGSTGKSKGVPITNKGVSNFLLWLTDKYRITENDRFLHQTSINFDISVLELFSPLISGATLVITNQNEIKIWDKVISILIDKKITLLQYVPSALWGLLAGIDNDLELKLRIVFSGGEPLTKELRELFFEKMSCKLVNLYGPTEASIYISSNDCQSGNQPVNIGKPIYNSQIYILDKYLNPLPIGTVGELYLSGLGLSKEYVNNNEETKKRFVKNKKTKELMFRTGDLGRYLNDGNIYFLGRLDKQVKIRGFRVELSEIEHVFLQFKSIKEAIALVHEISATDKRIIVFYTVKINEQLPSRQELQHHLKQFLPFYMIPSEFIEMKTLIYLPNGKLDTNGLLSQIDNLRNMDEFPNFTTATSTEQKISNIWKKVLGHSNFSVGDNFFDVGGHSLLIVEMKEIIEEVFHKNIALTDMYKYTSIKSLSKLFMSSEENKSMVNNIRSRIAKRKKFRPRSFDN